MARIFTPFLPMRQTSCLQYRYGFSYCRPPRQSRPGHSPQSAVLLLVSISQAKAASTAVFATEAFTASTATQMECSEELCVIRITLILWLASVSNKRLLKPGMPAIPCLPGWVTKFLLMLDMPCTALPFLVDSFCITVPSSPGQSIFNPYRNVLAHHRLNGGRVNYLGAKMRQLHCPPGKDGREWVCNW